MKRYLVITILICCTISASSQKTYMDKIADSTCKCLIAGKDKIKNSADFDKLGETCIMMAAIPYLDSLAKDENVPLDKMGDEIGEKVGQKIGLKLVTNCPEFVQLMALYSDEEDKSDIIRGVVTAVQITDQVYVSIKEPSGKVTKLVWLEYFPGADAYKSNPAKLNGKKVEIEWKEEEIYNKAKKDFIAVKVISQLTVK